MSFRDVVFSEGLKLSLVCRNPVRKDELVAKVIVKEDHDVSSFNLVAASKEAATPYYYFDPVTGKVIGKNNVYATLRDDEELRDGLAARIFDWFLVKLAWSHSSADPDAGAVV
jgi:hypothetical protein